MGSEADERRARLSELGEMAAEVAHELRNALQVISSSAYVASGAMDRGAHDVARPHLLKIERNARAAHAVIDDVMALARGAVLVKETVLLAELITSARAHSDLAAATWDDSSVPPDLKVLAHPRLFARMLHAIYENAIHASAPRGPIVSTSAQTEPGRIVVEIADDGPGVPPAIAEHVFEPLVSERPGGTGFGLSLARRIVIAHGGSLTLVPPRRAGATFRIELPVT